MQAIIAFIVERCAQYIAVHVYLLKYRMVTFYVWSNITYYLSHKTVCIYVG